MERLLVLVRHGQSDWNLKNLFTGREDPGLTDKGIAEATAAGQRLSADGFDFDLAYTSSLVRAQHTLSLMLTELGQSDLETVETPALDERDYGDLTGLNKADAADKWGKEQVLQWRRSYDTPPPGGESLKDTAARVLPFYITDILPNVMSGRRTMVAAHGNSLRALVMVLDKMSPQEVTELNLATGVPLVYRLNDDTSVASREMLEIDA